VAKNSPRTVAAIAVLLAYTQRDAWGHCKTDKWLESGRQNEAVTPEALEKFVGSARRMRGRLVGFAAGDWRDVLAAQTREL